MKRSVLGHILVLAFASAFIVCCLLFVVCCCYCYCYLLFVVVVCCLLFVVCSIGLVGPGVFRSLRLCLH